MRCVRYGLVTTISGDGVSISSSREIVVSRVTVSGVLRYLVRSSRLVSRRSKVLGRLATQEAHSHRSRNPIGGAGESRVRARHATRRQAGERTRCAKVTVARKRLVVICCCDENSVSLFTRLAVAHSTNGREGLSRRFCATTNGIVANDYWYHFRR